MPAEIPDGAVLVARGILNSSLWTMRPEDRIVALTCIALCNKKPKKWWDGSEEITIKPGQFVRSREGLQKACHMPLQRVRTSVLHLENTGFLTRFSTRMYTIYTIPKYLHYQDFAKYSDSAVKESNPESNQQLTSNQPQTTITKRRRTQSGSSAKPKGPGKTLDSVVVVEEKTEDPILDKTSLVISADLLGSIEMTPQIAHGFAALKPVRQILRVVQEARQQKKPAAWARAALEGDWTLPPASGDELLRVVEMVRGTLKRTDDYFQKKAGSILAKFKRPERLADETDDSYMRRVLDAKRKEQESFRAASDARGREAKKAT